MSDAIKVNGRKIGSRQNNNSVVDNISIIGKIEHFHKKQRGQKA